MQIVIACEDPVRLSEFWAPALGYIPEPPPEGFETWEAFADAVGIPAEMRNDIGAVIDPDGRGPRLLFERYDGGAPNQRVHFDVNVIRDRVDDEERKALLAKERARLEALGATFKREATGIAGEYWIELFDPEGNWFCVQ
ncbi:MAG: VOC family protein [Actinomycetota bacterium]|nr:VOC family protein [Actinomycetota bacterium]